MKIIRNEAHTDVAFPALAKGFDSKIWMIYDNELVSGEKGYRCINLETGEIGNHDSKTCNGNFTFLSVGSEVKLFQTSK